MNSHPLREVEVAGIGSTPFGQRSSRDHGSLAAEALDAAISDAGLTQDDVEQVVFSNATAGVLWGQEGIRGEVALKGTRLAGAPVFNTENACASGTAAAHLAWLAVASGRADVALALGVEKLHHPDKSRSFAAIQSATDVRESLGDGITGGSVAMGEYAREARAWAVDHGDIATALAAIAVKNRAYASSNAYAQFRAPTTADDVLASRVAAGVPGQRPHRP